MMSLSRILRPRKAIASFLKSNPIELKENLKEQAAKRVDKLLELPEGCTREKAIKLKVKMQALQEGLAGYAVPEGKFPTIPVRVLDEESDQPNDLEILNPYDPRVIDFNKCHQLDFLHYLLYFFIYSYYSLANNPEKRSETEQKLQVAGENLLAIHIYEAWMILNAYLIRKKYSEIIREMNGDKEDKIEPADENKMRSFISSMLDEIMAGSETEFEYCIPAGSPTHAVYLTLMYKRQSRGNLIIIINNPSKGNEEPILFNCGEIKEEEARSQVIKYLTEVCLNMKVGRSLDPIKIINNAVPEKERFSFERIKNKDANYPPRPAQTGPNCVWHGFGREQWYRLYRIAGSSDDSVYNWLFNETKHFHVDITNPPLFEEHCKMRANLYPVDSVFSSRRSPKGIVERAPSAAEESIRLNSTVSQPFADLQERKKILEELNTELLIGKSNTIALVGMPGVGKTQLALRYAETYKDKYNGLTWMFNSETAEDLNRSFLEFIKNFYDDDYDQLSYISSHDILRLVHEKLKKIHQMLLIFDNPPDEDSVIPYLPIGKIYSHHILITSRLNHWKNDRIKIIPFPQVDLFTPEEAEEFVGTILKKKYQGNESKESIKNLCVALGRLPLALSQAVYVIGRNRTIDSYLDQYNRTLESKKSLFVKAAHSEQVYKYTVANTWGISINIVKKQCKKTEDILNRSAYLDSDNIPKCLFVPLFDTLDEVEVAISILADYSLVETINNTKRDMFKLHRLSQEVLRIEHFEKKDHIYLHSALQLLDRVFEIDRIDEYESDVKADKEKENVEKFIPHVERALSYAINTDNFPDEINNLTLTLSLKLAAYYSSKKKDYKKVISIINPLQKWVDKLQLEKDIKPDDALQRENSKRIARTYMLLANAYVGLSDESKGAYYCKKYSELSWHDEDSIDAIQYYVNTGVLERFKGNYSKALELYNIAYEKAKTKGKDLLEASALYYMGSALASSGSNFKLAEEKIRAAINKKIKVYGTDNHVSLTASYNVLGEVLVELNNPHAKDYLMKSLDLNKVIFGNNHIQTGYPYYGLGRYFLRLRKYEESEEAYLRALNIFKANKNHTEMLTYHKLAELYKERNEKGDITKSIEMAKNALKCSEENKYDRYSRIKSFHKPNIEALLKELEAKNQASSHFNNGSLASYSARPRIGMSRVVSKKSGRQRSAVELTPSASKMNKKKALRKIGSSKRKANASDILQELAENKKISSKKKRKIMSTIGKKKATHFTESSLIEEASLNVVQSSGEHASKPHRFLKQSRFPPHLGFFGMRKMNTLSRFTRKPITGASKKLR